jgi:SSS family solute:Na+ symporter
MAFALWAAPFENLIQAVNILGSLFYGTILGIVLTAIFLKRVSSNGVLFGSLIAEVLVFYGYFFTSIGFLWFNVLGCLAVMIVGLILSYFKK